MFDLYVYNFDFIQTIISVYDSFGRNKIFLFLSRNQRLFCCKIKKFIKIICYFNVFNYCICKLFI